MPLNTLTLPAPHSEQLLHCLTITMPLLPCLLKSAYPRASALLVHRLMAASVAPQRRGTCRLRALVVLAAVTCAPLNWVFLVAPSPSRRDATAAAVAGLLAASVPSPGSEVLAADALTGVKLVVCGDDACKKPFEAFSKDLKFDSFPLNQCQLLSPSKPAPGTGTDFPEVYARLTCKDSGVRLEAFATERCTGLYQDVEMSNGKSVKLPDIGYAILTWSDGC